MVDDKNQIPYTPDAIKFPNSVRTIIDNGKGMNFSNTEYEDGKAYLKCGTLKKSIWS
jgi:hypothetical protein